MQAALFFYFLIWKSMYLYFSKSLPNFKFGNYFEPSCRSNETTSDVLSALGLCFTREANSSGRGLPRSDVWFRPHRGGPSPPAGSSLPSPPPRPSPCCLRTPPDRPRPRRSRVSGPRARPDGQREAVGWGHEGAMFIPVDTRDSAAC